MTTTRASARRRAGTTRIIAAAITDIVSLLLSALWLMLLIGDVHRDWLPRVPSVSYGFSVLLSALAGAIARGWLISHDRDKAAKA